MYVIETKEKRFFVLAQDYASAVNYVVECNPEIENNSYEIEEYKEGEIIEEMR